MKKTSNTDYKRHPGKHGFQLIDLTGRRFGKLVVLHRDKDHIAPNGAHIPMWECICDCGKKFIVSGRGLREGYTTHCGCDRVNHCKRKGNFYDLSGEYGIGYTSKGEPFWFDLEDYDKIKKYTWHYENGYVITTYNQKQIRLHRLVMGVNDPEIIVDHISHPINTIANQTDIFIMDNRKSNLRIATQSQNNQNKGLQSNNTSGYPGISWDKKNQKWQTYIYVNCKRIFLGRFLNFEDALQTRQKAEQYYFQEYQFIKNNQYQKKENKNDLSTIL